MSKSNEVIRIRGARVHNLKNVDIDIPLKQLVCFAGPSGSGKTSLAFHTLLNESKRRFVNSFPNSMKFFADRPTAVDVDEIFPVLPVFGLPQINPVMGSRSVVADIMRITENLQSLFFHYSQEFCPTHDLAVKEIGFSSQLEKVSKVKEEEVWHLLIDKEIAQAVFEEGFIPARSYSVKAKLINEFSHTDEFWEVLRFKHSTLSSLDQRNAELIKKIKDKPLKLYKVGIKKLLDFNFQSQKQCPDCDYSGLNQVTVSAFSPHSALGACKACNGYGANLVFDRTKMIDEDLSYTEGGLRFLQFSPLDWYSAQLDRLMKKKKWPVETPLREMPKAFFDVLENGEGEWEGFEEIKNYLNSKRYKPAVRVFLRKMQKEVVCHDCKGSRLDMRVGNFKLKRLALRDFSEMTLAAFRDSMQELSKSQKDHAQKICVELFEKAKLACEMGLGHLSLERKTRSLSAGEYQRLLLLKYLSFKGTDSLFILDEPSLGLGPHEQDMLILGLRQIIAQGNTVIIIDHSHQMQAASDFLVLMGPESGGAGGEIIKMGTSSDVISKAVKTKIEKKQTAGPAKKTIKVEKPQIYGHTFSNFEIPLDQLLWVHGDSGSGKTSAVVKILAQHIFKSIHKENLVDEPGTCKKITGHQGIQDVIVIDSNLNRFTSRSSVGTLTDFAPVVRKHFLKLPVAKALGLKDGHLSANSELGMCIKCEGRGHLVIEMQYLEDIILPCDDCKGKKMKPIYAEISDGHMTVAEAFNLPLSQVLSRIDLTPKFKRTWEYLKILNLDYLSLDRPLNSLSGGEKQRLYLLSKLLKNIESSLVVFENLSFGLSEKELIRIGQFLKDLSLRGNTLVVIDSDPIFSKFSDSELIFNKDSINLKYL
jgi:excinuclease ABC subunit A